MPLQIKFHPVVIETVMKFCEVMGDVILLDCNIWKWIFWEIYDRAKIVKVMAVWTFFSRTWCDALSATPWLNGLQDCNEIQWRIRLPYLDMHIVRGLCLGKNYRNGGCWNNCLLSFWLYWNEKPINIKYPCQVLTKCDCLFLQCQGSYGQSWWSKTEEQ